MSEPEDLQIIRPKQLAKLLGVSSMTLWRWEQRGDLPKKIPLGPNTRGYRRSDIEAFFGPAGRGGGAVTAVSSGTPWTSCRACGWAGGPFDYRVVEAFCRSPSGTNYWIIRARCPRCGGEVPRQ